MKLNTLIALPPFWARYLKTKKCTVSKLSRLLKMPRATLYNWVSFETQPNIYVAIDFTEKFNDLWDEKFTVEELWGVA